jgi:hypothetical protein
MQQISAFEAEVRPLGGSGHRIFGRKGGENARFLSLEFVTYSDFITQLF